MRSVEKKREQIFSDEDLLNMINDPRKPVLPRHRRSKEGMTWQKLTIAVAKKTGFQRTEVRIVLDALIQIIFETLMNGMFVSLKGIITLYSAPKKARQATRFGGHSRKCGDQMIAPPRWELKTQVNAFIREELRRKIVTKEDIESIYQRPTLRGVSHDPVE